MVQSLQVQRSGGKAIYLQIYEHIDHPYSPRRLPEEASTEHRSIAQLPPQSKVGLVCRSKQFQGDIMNTLRESKISFASFTVVETDNIEELTKQVALLDAAIVSPGRLQDVQHILSGSTVPVIEFVYRLSTASMRLIKTLIVENQRKSETARHIRQ